MNNMSEMTRENNQTEVRLQRLLWPQAGLCTERKMYFRTNEKCLLTGECLHMEKGGKVSSDTYFNGVSIDKWKKYTVVGSLYLRLRLQGRFRLSLRTCERAGEETIRRVCDERIIKGTGEEICLHFPGEIRGMAYFYLEALENHCQFLGGEYDTVVCSERIRNVKLAIAICTFKRETFIYRNMEILRKYLIENETSALHGRLEVYISDNGKSLERDRISSDQVHVFPNKNAGGSSGFTRGMIEVMKANQAGDSITHMILMDDDVTIEPESIEKTYRILTLLKEEYMEAFIGGAMLQSDKQNMQVESGAVWRAGNLVSLKSGLNMNKLSACLYNELEEAREYNAWWYCCIPMGVVREDNLPMPVFIRGDDVEYGLRNMKTLILMNGICVWHEPFYNKYSSYLSYYILRNLLIDNALHFPQYGKKELKKSLLGQAIRELFYYRYKNVDLLIQGVRDYLKGVDWLLRTDGEALHKKIMDRGYKAQNVDELPMEFLYSTYKNSLVENDRGLRKYVRLASFNGYLLPATRDNVVSMARVRPYNAYRARRILYYDAAAHKGFVTQRNYRELIRCLLQLLRLNQEIDKKFDAAKNEYRQRQKELQNSKFWNQYLGLKKED
ncbi:MAG: glycosyltransferase [Clostridiales bacterium]|nr:glycosyltransferase [Clostridiales bacterium]